MADVQFFKTVGALPATLEPDAFYAVRTGQGFSLYLTDSTGAIAHSLNLGGNANVGDLLALTNEIAAARAGRASLNDRISLVAGFASPNAGPFIPGRWYDQAFHGGNSVNHTASQNRTELCPFYCSEILAIDRIGVAVVTAGPAGGLGRMLIYESDPSTGWPTNLVYESPDIDLSIGTGFQGADLATPFVFERASVYWVGYRLGATNGLVIRGIANTTAINFGLITPDGNTYASLIRKAGGWGTTTTPVWPNDPSLLTNGNAPSIRMRATDIPEPDPGLTWLRNGQAVTWINSGQPVTWTTGA